jgi:hypothetical protein
MGGFPRRGPTGLALVRCPVAGGPARRAASRPRSALVARTGERSRAAVLADRARSRPGAPVGEERGGPARR